MIDISDVELILKNQHQNYLETMLSSNMNRITLAVFKAKSGIRSQVYGLESGEEGIYPAGEIEALVSGDSFFPSDLASAGTLTEGWLYTLSPILNAGDLVEFKRLDQRTRRYKVVELNRVGSSQSVFTKFRLSALGD